MIFEGVGAHLLHFLLQRGSCHLLKPSSFLFRVQASIGYQVPLDKGGSDAYFKRSSRGPWASIGDGERTASFLSLF